MHCVPSFTGSDGTDISKQKSKEPLAWSGCHEYLAEGCEISFIACVRKKARTAWDL